MLVRELLPLGRIGRGGFWLRHLLILPLALFLCIGAEQIVGRPFGVVASLAFGEKRGGAVVEPIHDC